MIDAILFLSIGLAFLIYGANLLITSTDEFSKKLSISGFIASFFLIGIATSAPEIFISIESALQNETILAVGNSIGSNISNLALVFCFAVLFMKKNQQTMFIPGLPFFTMIILTIVCFSVIYPDSIFDKTDSYVLLALFFFSLLLFNSKNEIPSESSENLIKANISKILVHAIIGITLLIYGSKFFIDGATNIALMFGVSAYVIGLTLTALGTSLPELVTTVQSARKGKGQFIIGNILGSNIFNIGVAMSIAGLINPAIIDSNAFLRDILLLFLSTIFFYVITKSTKHTIKVVYSILLITIYCIYILIILK